jgi:hypothetical protein
VAAIESTLLEACTPVISLIEPWKIQPGMTDDPFKTLPRPACVHFADQLFAGLECVAPPTMHGPASAWISSKTSPMYKDAKATAC